MRAHDSHLLCETAGALEPPLSVDALQHPHGLDATPASTHSAVFCKRGMLARSRGEFLFNLCELSHYVKVYNLIDSFVLASSYHAPLHCYPT
jgi:hypothetical protein